MANNPFDPISKEEQKRRAQELLDTQNKIKKTVETAAACLIDERFLKYREDVKSAREGLIVVMKQNSDPDPLRFAFMAKACLAKIDVLDMIIDLVEKDLRKGKG